MWYNMTSCDFSDFLTVSTCANTISSNILMPLILGTIWLIMLIGISYTGRSFFRGLTFSSLICSVLSIFLVFLNFLNKDYMYLLFILTGVGLIGVKLSEAPS